MKSICKRVLIATLTSVGSSVTAQGQLAPCQTDPISLAAGTMVPSPGGERFTSVRLARATDGGDLDSNTVNILGGVAQFTLESPGTSWSPGNDVVNGLGSLGAMASNVGIVWLPEGCVQAVTADVDPPQVTPRTSSEECRRLASVMEGDIDERENGPFTFWVLRENRGLCYANRDFGVVGDPIYVGIFTSSSSLWQDAEVDFDPCRIQPEAPNVLVSGNLNILSGVQAPRGTIHEFGPRRCYNTGVQITVSPGPAPPNVTPPQPQTVYLDQYQKYRATVQAGVLFTDTQHRSFGLRPDGSDQVIFDKGPEGKGPRYFASLVLYGVLKYLPSLGGGDGYEGRDVVHDNSFTDRLGLLLGVGLSSPANEFAIGASFEVITGVNAIGGWYFAKTRVLEGLSEGDPFVGQAADIPTKEEWRSDFNLGLSIDLRYLTGLFQGQSL